ncbi:hypothetical protein FS837_003409 [Tulasnella sp. UAMH 9824]|nr:hypothetical protein FS837_003409 [Tulasnella sp. UAMH 9824]
MDSIPAHSNLPRVGLHLIPDDIILYIFDVLESTTVAAMTLANRHLQELATPTLYRNITIPRKEGRNIEHLKSAARLLRTLSGRPSLTILVQYLENAPPHIPLHLLGSIWSEHTDLSGSHAVAAEQSAHSHPRLRRLAVDAMKSCVNLRSLGVAGTFSLEIVESSPWLAITCLLDSRIKLKMFKTSANWDDSVSGKIWNHLVARILDVQLSLDYLDFPFTYVDPPLGEERMEKWAPKLRILVGSRTPQLKALLSDTRPIETLVVRSVSMNDMALLCGDQLGGVDTIKEIIYQGPEVVEPFTSFPAMFGAMPPSLRIFRGEIWLDLPAEDCFFQFSITML